MVKVFKLIMQQAARQPSLKFVPPSIVIIQQPAGFTGQAGAAFQILIVSNGTGYALYKGNTLISQNKTGIFDFVSASISDSGNSYCIVTDDYNQSLQSVSVTVVITKDDTTPLPDPGSNPQPINGAIIRLNTVSNNKTYNNTALVGKNFILLRNGYQRFLFPFEYDVLSTGGFELHLPLITGDCIIVMPLDDNIIQVSKLTDNKAYSNTSLAGKTYPVFRNGYSRLLAAHELDFKSSGGFELHSPIITGDTVVVFAGAALLSNLNHNSQYKNTALQGVEYTLYHEGLGRFLNDSEFDKITGGGFKLHTPLALNERLIVFKL